MARPHVEFIQSQRLPWENMPDGSEVKRLNADPESSEATTLVRVPAGWSCTHHLPAHAEEYFILDGAVDFDGVRHDRHAYAFLPPSAAWRLAHSATGATFIRFDYAVDDADARAAPPIRLHAPTMPWDMSTYDPKLRHLGLARKVLRLGPNGSNRTYLLTGLPHGRPDETEMPVELHPHSEEMFMLAGEMSAPEGVMRPGAYFYRPPGILHGPHVSDFGFLMLMRSPGTDRIVTEWQTDLRTVPVDPPFRPVLPPDAPDSWREYPQPAPAY